MSDLRTVHDIDGAPLQPGFTYYCNDDLRLVSCGMHVNARDTPNDDEAFRMSLDFPAYWRRLPGHWVAVDTYRVDDLFPLPSSRLFHARKKLLVPGIRTGGKSLYADIKEAHRTLGSWLADQPEHSE